MTANKKLIIMIIGLIFILILFVLMIRFIFSDGGKTGEGNNDEYDDDVDEDDVDEDDVDEDDVDEDDGGTGGDAEVDEDDGGTGGGTSDVDEDDGGTGGGTSDVDDVDDVDQSDPATTQEIGDVYNVKSITYSTQFSDTVAAVRVLLNDGVWTSEDDTYENSNPVTKGSYASWLLIDNNHIYGQYVIINLSSSINYTKFYLNNQKNDNSPKDFRIIAKKNNTESWTQIQQSDGRDGGKIKYFNGLGTQGNTYDSYGIIVTKAQPNAKSVTIQNLFFINGSKQKVYYVSASSVYDNRPAYKQGGDSIRWQTNGGYNDNVYGYAKSSGAAVSLDFKGQWIRVKLNNNAYKSIVSKIIVTGLSDNNHEGCKPDVISLFGTDSPDNVNFINIISKYSILDHVPNKDRANIANNFTRFEWTIDIDTLYNFKYYIFQCNKVMASGGFCSCDVQFFS